MNPILFSVLSLSFLSGLVVLLSGCSGFNDVKVTHKTTAPAEVYVLQTEYNAPVNFSSRAMVDQAKKVCPTGYEMLAQQAIKSAEFAQEDASCAAGQNCHYLLEWHIQCVEKPKEEKSIFGKT
ncbi:MAG: hypothetical protein CO158_00935 [Piscirickettsiaceae bacterium CG_4_9_14_3_um_filter_43_564]|nr:hypothetical protein [Thiomicrospira sp.]OIP94729.1 MAG: hypothetical protein AUK56_07950 [Thiomicrospira sp. CG2_30_44_34]PIQ03195.1 MAG: hypothetical protein COW74_07965 [Piscirickettsiaceae bacterium CG18_big_fil_WC_8_21_14_2_50_44_103]PIU39470.1 MAG: hypothetical protein COT01_01245 [Piscirickettsiaceae bacterium CG07_land_8_20_14_0_80_44_28]PIW58557.1 MAG: hypothetical protein COW14_00665 [Piscirickettsiaceae bacterium CG12_big_fil_rev_8_21_14_0_65_44_934]PIW78416.1 MAG: hypothetical p